MRSRLATLRRQLAAAGTTVTTIWYRDGDAMVESGTGRRLPHAEWERRYGATAVPFTFDLGWAGAPPSGEAIDIRRGQSGDGDV